MNDLITASALARRWSVTPAHVYRLAKRQRDPLPCRHVGGAVRFDADEARAWLDRQGPAGEIRVKLVDVEC